MKRWMLLCFVASLFVTSDADAFRLFRRRSTGSNYSGQSLSGNDQQRCQQKAEILARVQPRMGTGASHRVAPLIGGFEGIGCGTSRNCNTCTPRGGMRLTGDGAAQASNGMWYRCRSWR